MAVIVSILRVLRPQMIVEMPVFVAKLNMVMTEIYTAIANVATHGNATVPGTHPSVSGIVF